VIVRDPRIGSLLVTIRYGTDEERREAAERLDRIIENQSSQNGKQITRSRGSRRRRR
jgi:hypothetical protein